MVLLAIKIQADSFVPFLHGNPPPHCPLVPAASGQEAALIPLGFPATQQVLLLPCIQNLPFVSEPLPGGICCGSLCVYATLSFWVIHQTLEPWVLYSASLSVLPSGVLSTRVSYTPAVPVFSGFPSFSLLSVPGTECSHSFPSKLCWASCDFSLCFLTREFPFSSLSHEMSMSLLVFISWLDFAVILSLLLRHIYRGDADICFAY